MRRRRAVLPLAAAALWLAAVGMFEWLRPAGNSASLCLFRNVTGLPCPTCGSTRAALSLASGRPLEALRHNPLVICAAGAGAVWLLLRAAGCAPRFRAGPRAPALLATATVVLVAANWCWVLAHDGPGPGLTRFGLAPEAAPGRSAPPGPRAAWPP